MIRRLVSPKSDFFIEPKYVARIKILRYLSDRCIDGQVWVDKILVAEIAKNIGNTVNTVKNEISKLVTSGAITVHSKSYGRYKNGVSKYNCEPFSKEYKKRAYINHMYKTTLEHIQSLYDSQDGCCAICKVKFDGYPSKNCHIDHCHETGEVRGILCRKCNQGIGYFDERCDILESAKEYIGRHKAA